VASFAGRVNGSSDHERRAWQRIPLRWRAVAMASTLLCTAIVAGLILLGVPFIVSLLIGFLPNVVVVYVLAVRFGYLLDDERP